MLNLLSELFLPPYEIYDIFLIALLVLFCVYTILMLFNLVVRFQISHFFNVHEVETGKVIKYEIFKGSSYSIISPLVPSASTVFVPHFHHTPDEYSVLLECCHANKRFQARYSIPADDYKEHRAGETIQIEDSWEPIGYQFL